MTYTYKLSPLEHGIQASVVRIEDNATIPCDEANKDYQKYLEWVAEGNEPDPADE